MKVLSNNYHPDSIFGLFVGREMIIRNLSLASRKKCIEKYNFEGDMMPFTWRVCAKIRGPPVVDVNVTKSLVMFFDKEQNKSVCALREILQRSPGCCKRSKPISGNDR